MSKTRIYARFIAMKQRCQNPNHLAYDNYGGREDAPILVCEYYCDFQNWFADVGDAPEGMWLDRIDNDRGYEPGNIRWAPPSVQVRNRRPPKRKARRAKSADINAYALTRSGKSNHG
jgi:hypothetical protein